MIFIVVLLLTSYVFYSDSLPLRTPNKVARLVSGLKMPEGIKFEMVQDDLALKGDGTTHVKAKLTNKQLSELVRQATE